MQECREAGIRPIMITGDHRDTAVAIAKQLGILERRAAGHHRRTAGRDSATRNWQGTLANTPFMPGCSRSTRCRIVNAWKQNGCITAMTGDGVNDAPSIKSADIGVGMGITGTDVTKNVADMVLADDNFATIVAAVAEGRRIYDNIRKSIQLPAGLQYVRGAVHFLCDA